MNPKPIVKSANPIKVKRSGKFLDRIDPVQPSTLEKPFRIFGM